MCTLSRNSYRVYDLGLGYALARGPCILNATVQGQRPLLWVKPELSKEASGNLDTGWVGLMIWRWKMPIMQAFFSSLGRSELIRYIPSSVSLSTSLFGTVALPLPATLSSPPSFVHHPHHRLGKGGDGTTETRYAVCQPRADVPGRAPLSDKVSNKESFGPRAARQVVGLSTLWGTPPRWCFPAHSVYSTPTPPPFFFITKVAGIQKNLLTNCFLVYFPSTFPPSGLKGDKSKEPLRLCGCVYAKGEAEGTHRANKTRFPLGPNLIIFCCRCQADGAAWFLI